MQCRLEKLTFVAIFPFPCQVYKLAGQKIGQLWLLSSYHISLQKVSWSNIPYNIFTTFPDFRIEQSWLENVGPQAI